MIGKKKSSLRICKVWEQQEHEAGAGAVIEILHGKGVLQCQCEADEDAMYLTLTLADTPLIQLQGEEYFCPTCEKIIRSAYQLEEKEAFQLPNINASKQDVNLSQAIEQLTPLLTLLPSGFYVILDTQLHPTDGNGHLFWEIDTQEVPSQGTCDYYLGNFTYANSYPHFCVATQPWSSYNEQRVQYYRTHADARAIAYHLDGFLCGLLDGHHKTMAAAIEKRDVNALVILSCGFCRYQNEGITLRASQGLEFTAEELGVKPIVLQNAMNAQSYATKKNLQARIPTPSLTCARPFTSAYANKLASYYPNVATQARMDQVKDLSDETLSAILTGSISLIEEDATTLLIALAGHHHPFFWKMGAVLCRQNYSHQAMYELLECMMTHPEKNEHMNFLIEQFIAYEDNSYIKQMMCRYL